MSKRPEFSVPLRGDDGFAMVVSVIVGTVAVLLVTTVLTMGLHLDSATSRDRKWNLALQVAELGVERDAAELNAAIAAGGTYAGASTPAVVPGGQVSTKVTAISGGYQIDAIGYVPSATAPNHVKRRIRVQYLPEPRFRYAIFSEGALFVKSTGGVQGDVFGNLDAELWNGTVVEGSVVSATGKVLLNQNARVARKADGTGGDVFSGGLDTASSPQWGIKLDNNAVIEGDAHVQVPTAASPCPSASNYNISNSGTIGGRALLPGAVNGPAPLGGAVAACEQRYSVTTLPPFQPSALAGLTNITPAQFEAISNLQGRYRVVASEDEVIDFACQTITGDFTLVTEAVIRKSNSCGSTPTFSGPPTAVIHLISENDSHTTESNPAIDFENHFELPGAPNPSPAMLLYSRGFCDLKNSVITSGAVYCKGINIKNTLDIRYDPRVEAVLGFGDYLYVRSNFRELSSTTAL